MINSPSNDDLPDFIPVTTPEWMDAGPGNFPWDEWETKAQAAGLGDLAALGRAVIREAYQHNWSADLKRECGWEDDGEQMLEQALAERDKVRARWEYLLRTDGEYLNPDDLD